MQISIYNLNDTPIGKGGMGQVYLGSDPQGNRVAIKEMLSQYVSDPHLRARFHQEVNILNQLEHPSIVKMYASFEESGNLYLVMEYVEGETIEQYVKRCGVLPEKEAAAIMSQILSALQYAHSKGFVHRDIKPSNIMIRPDRTACLLDFGIAKDMTRTAGGSGMTTTIGMTIGTVGYMSPEQAEGLSIDHRTDIYSLGCVLFYMLTGQHAVKEESNEIKTRIAIINNPFPKAVDFNAKLSKDILQILDKATQKNMNLRYQSCQQFETEIKVIVPSKENELLTQLNTAQKQLKEAQKQLKEAQKQLKEVEESRGKHTAAWIFLLIACITAVISFSSALSNRNSKISSLEGNVLYKADKVSSLEIEVSDLKIKNSNLKSKIPVTYQVISNNSFYYYKLRCDESYEPTNCCSNSGFYVTIYEIKDGYGLSEYGWIKMSNLKKY